MIFSVNFDTKDFEAKARQLEADVTQVPFAMAVALNNAAFAARRVLVDRVWPQHVNARNSQFLNASLQVDRASKGDLSVVVYDKLQRGHLYEHTHGGTITPTKGRVFAIPIKGMVKRGAWGVAAADRPRNLTSGKRGVVVTHKGIFIRKDGKLKLMYLFKSSVVIRKDVPLIEAFQYTVMEEMRTGFTRALAYAMATAKH